jgi:hypothetical protein
MDMETGFAALKKIDGEDKYLLVVYGDGDQMAELQKLLEPWSKKWRGKYYDIANEMVGAFKSVLK